MSDVSFGTDDMEAASVAPSADAHEANTEPHPFREFEEGYPDVDMFSGALKVQHLCHISQMWHVSGHRTTSNLDPVKRWMQLASSPALVYIMQDYDTKAHLKQGRAAVVEALRGAGYDVDPYVSLKETATRPQTVINGNMVMTAYELSHWLKTTLNIRYVSYACVGFVG